MSFLRTISIFALLGIGSVEAGVQEFVFQPTSRPSTSKLVTSQPGGTSVRLFADCFFWSCTDGIALNYRVKERHRRPGKNGGTHLQTTSFRQTFRSSSGTFERTEKVLYFVTTQGDRIAIADATGKFFGDVWQFREGVEAFIERKPTKNWDDYVNPTLRLIISR